MIRDGALSLRRAEQQPGQEEVPEMIDAERLLEVLRRLMAFRPDPAGVVDQHIEAVPSGQYVGGGGAHRRQVGEIERDHMHVVVARPSCDFPGGVVSLLLVATGQHGRRPLRRHPHGRLLSDAVVTARDDHDLALHAHDSSAFGGDDVAWPSAGHTPPGEVRRLRPAGAVPGPGGYAAMSQARARMAT